MDYDDEEDTPQRHAPTSRLNWADIALAGVISIQGLHQGISNGLEYLASCLGAHSTTIGEQQEFKKTVGRAIETINADGQQ